MRYLHVFWLGMLLTLSCEKANPPEEILSQGEMVKVLQQLYISEEHVGRLGLKSDSARKVFDRLEVKLFDKLNVKDSVFIRSFNYYMGQPEQWEQIYAMLVDSLNLREQRLSLPAEKE
jgi:Domain of unknown function (DUF4296)